MSVHPFNLDGWIEWIQSVYTEPDARRRGVYSALHRGVLERAAADPDVRAVRLYVVAHNEPARRSYARLGMHCTDYRIYEQSAGP